MATFVVKRIYDEPSSNDGYRVLVDRLWPRGVSKQKAALDFWLKDIAPSPELRTWFAHDPSKFEEFKARYQSELAINPAVKDFAEQTEDKPKVTLLYAAHDPKINHAVVLRDFLDKN